ncbi:MAG: fasciclin domain-containing protein [Algibacter sp.]
MKQRNGLITMLAFVIIISFSCKPDPLEYARPDDLAGTITQQLESMGTFNNYLKSLNQTRFKEPLEKGGSWTVFAPTDEAFEQFMSDEGYANFEAIPSDMIESIVEYSIVIDGWNTTTLTYFRNRFYLGQAFRRRTQFELPNVEYSSDSLQHFSDWESGKYLVDASGGRLKTTNYFIESYMDVNGVEYSDYDFMFPGETFNAGDMKVFGANVSQKDLVAENGIIYALDKVFVPKKNLYHNLTSPEYDGKYTMFKKLVERFASFREIGDEINLETGETETISQLRFTTGIENDALPFSIYDENYPSNIDATLAQAYGLLVPTNEALDNYLKGDNILAEFYDSYDEMPIDVVGKFLSPYFFNNYYDICPSRFGQSFDTSLGLVDYKPEDVVDKKFCSNGFFVGVNTVYTNSSFGTIMGPLLLDPEYSIMLGAVQRLGIDTALQSKGVRFSILGLKNDQFIDIADPSSATRRITITPGEEINGFLPFSMDVSGDRVYLNTVSADIGYINTTIEDIVLNQIIDEDIDFNINNYYQTRSGEFVYAFDGNSVVGGGNIEENTVALIEEIKETENGNFYEISSATKRPFNFTYLTLIDNAEFSSFLEVLDVAGGFIDIVGIDDKLFSFLNLQRTFTLLAPNNAAVAQAIADGVIVEPSTVSGLPELESAIAKADLLNFAKKHFLQQALTTDGKTTGIVRSMFFSRIIDFAPVYDEFSVENTTTSISITNEETGESVTTGSMTNILSKRIVIHEINNYIK